MDAQDMTMTAPIWREPTTNSIEGVGETKRCVVLTGERKVRRGSYSRRGQNFLSGSKFNQIWR